MPRLTFRKAGLLSPKTLRNEIVQGVDQMRDMDGGDTGEYASANSVFPVVNLDAPTKAFFTIGGTMAPMRHVPTDSESPVGALGDLDEKDITTKPYKKKLAPEKETDTKLNSERQILSLYRWAASQLRGETFLTRERVSWRGDEVTDGLVGTDGNTPHPDIPTANVIDPATQYSDQAASKPYNDVEYASYLIDETYQGFMNSNAPTRVECYLSPSVMRDLKLNDDMSDRFSGVEVRGLTESQVRRLVDSEIPNLRKVRVQLPRTDGDGNYLDEDGTVVNDLNDAELDNALEPYDPSVGRKRRNIIVGTPGQSSAFIPWFGENMGAFDDADAPDLDDEVTIDSARGFGTQTWMSHDPRATWLKAFQDIGFHLHLPKQWVVIRDV